MQTNICSLFSLSREIDTFPELRSNRHARTIPLREASIASLCYIHPLSLPGPVTVPAPFLSIPRWRQIVSDVSQAGHALVSAAMFDHYHTHERVLPNFVW
ncbi:hypothetical protein CGRA01v4_07317 [Colletotrichum graminicola]|nr:hypothetical protein CGRA01v4_07317 [Colletotrichum graminicola]